MPTVIGLVTTSGVQCHSVDGGISYPAIISGSETTCFASTADHYISLDISDRVYSTEGQRSAAWFWAAAGQSVYLSYYYFSTRSGRQRYIFDIQFIG